MARLWFAMPAYVGGWNYILTRQGNAALPRYCTLPLRRSVARDRCVEQLRERIRTQEAVEAGSWIVLQTEINRKELERLVGGYDVQAAICERRLWRQELGGTSKMAPETDPVFKVMLPDYGRSLHEEASKEGWLQWAESIENERTRLQKQPDPLKVFAMRQDGMSWRRISELTDCSQYLCKKAYRLVKNQSAIRRSTS